MCSHWNNSSKHNHYIDHSPIEKQAEVIQLRKENVNLTKKLAALFKGTFCCNYVLFRTVDKLFVVSFYRTPSEERTGEAAKEIRIPFGWA